MLLGLRLLFNKTSINMAIYPKLSAQSQEEARPAVNTQPSQPISIEAWTEQATEALQAVSLSSASGVRGTSTSLSIPLDAHSLATHTRHSQGTDELLRLSDTHSAYRPRREPIRRDSLKRREALLKGKEGSRRRQRWENGSFLPHILK